MSNTKIAFIENNYEKKGIFFQVPWYRSAHEFTWSMYYGYKNSFLTWYRKAKWLIIPMLFNLRAIKLYKKYSNPDRHVIDEELPDGVMITRFRLPITFSRKVRGLLAVFPKGSTISSIHSWGYEDSNCEVNGYCAKEFTTIEFHDGSKKKLLKKGRFHYTYRHVIEEEFGDVCAE